MIFNSRQRILFLILLNLKCIWGNKMNAKILGGFKLSLQEAAHTALFFNVEKFCGCSVLTSWAVLTAAHCFAFNKEIQYMLVQVGNEGKKYDDKNSEMHQVIKFSIHQKFDEETFSHDIALVFLLDHIKLGSKVQRVLLANNNDFLTDYTPDAFLASGWGWTAANSAAANIFFQYPYGDVSHAGLLGVRLTLVKLHECERLHNVTLSADMFCLYGGPQKDSCLGDSGGGIIWKGLLVGLVSHGDGCGKKNKPGVYAKVYYFHNWIVEQLHEHEEKYCEPL